MYGQEKCVVPISVKDFKGGVARPDNCVLSTQKFKEKFGCDDLLTWQEDVKRHCAQYVPSIQVQSNIKTA
jgi:dTDP-4-dehydrorhamnose reductase